MFYWQARLQLATKALLQLQPLVTRRTFGCRKTGFKIVKIKGQPWLRYVTYVSTVNTRGLVGNIKAES